MYRKEPIKKSVKQQRQLYAEGAKLSLIDADKNFVVDSVIKKNGEYFYEDSEGNRYPQSNCKIQKIKKQFFLYVDKKCGCLIEGLMTEDFKNINGYVSSNNDIAVKLEIPPIEILVDSNFDEIDNDVDEDEDWN